MSWHYRILRHPDGWLALHEVYCVEIGRPHSYATQAVSFGANADEGLGGIVNALETALKDARERPILDTRSFTSHQAPD